MPLDPRDAGPVRDPQRSHDVTRSTIGEGELDLVVFRLGRTRYAIPLAETRRILAAVAVTPLPDAPPAIEGVVSVHGDPVPVFDLRARFGLPHRRIRPEDHLVLAEAAGRRVLLHVDSVEGVRSVAGEALSAPERVVRGPTPLSGVARLPDGLVLIHDLALFLTEAEAAQLDRAMTAAARGGSAG